MAAKTLLGILLLLPPGLSAFAGGPRVLPAGQQPQDRRLGQLKDLRGYFPMRVPDTAQQWEQRAASVRRRVAVAAGLWPLPERTPLNLVLHGRAERSGFSVEKFYFESYPGHFVTGLLFRPKDDGAGTGKRPAVLSPHGHGGRDMEYGELGIRKKIAAGEERFLKSGRWPKLARCAQLARMGCVTMIYDMVGYVDSRQISRDVAHGQRDARPHMEHPQSWGFHTTQAELRCQSIFGLQAWNSLRALDALCSLPDVDASRVGVTGGSGGGTQTLVLGSLDPRPVTAFPQGMVSTSMQGGCPCENATLLRVGTGNVEFAALFAPKPIAMTAANDWTVQMMSKGYPELRKLYTLLGAPQNVACTNTVQFPHNFNYVTRTVMYHWMNQHLKLGLDQPILETDYEPLTQSETQVWDARHAVPLGGDDYERSLTRYLDTVSQRQLQALIPRDSATLQGYRKVVGGAFETIIRRGYPLSGSVSRDNLEKSDHGSYWRFKDLLTLKEQGEQLPLVSLYPKSTEFNGQVVLWLDGAGKDALFDAEGVPAEPVRLLLTKGSAVLAPDLFLQGEFTLDGQVVTSAPRVPGDREIPAYTFGYNDSVFVRRVHDVMTVVSFVRGHERTPEQVALAATGGLAPVALAARAAMGPAVDILAVDNQGFRFTDLQSVYDVRFLPGAVKYGGVPALVALSSPHATWVAGLPGDNSMAHAAFDAEQQSSELVVRPQSGEATSDLVTWLISKAP